MKRRFLLSIILFSLAYAAAAQEKAQSALDAMVEAERRFCRAAVENGIRDAFIANLADDATLFRPYAVAGKKWMIDHPAAGGLLTWEPIFADVSRAGDFGYTTGPWEFRRTGPDDKEVAHGNFITVWKKQADGSWKATVDVGIDNPPPALKAATLQTPKLPGKDAANHKRVDIEKSVDIESERAALSLRDREFSNASAAGGALKAYDAYLSNEARIFRDNLAPMIGKQSARALLSAVSGTLSWQPAKADVSSAGDLGYTFGVAELKKGGPEKIEYSNYVRIWKKQAGVWMVVLDIMKSAPAPAASAN
jgi:ketosteroid isomerase-like protein